MPLDPQRKDWIIAIVIRFFSYLPGLLQPLYLFSLPPHSSLASFLLPSHPNLIFFSLYFPFSFVHNLGMLTYSPSSSNPLASAAPRPPPSPLLLPSSPPSPRHSLLPLHLIPSSHYYIFRFRFYRGLCIRNQPLPTFPPHTTPHFRFLSLPSLTSSSPLASPEPLPHPAWFH